MMKAEGFVTDGRPMSRACRRLRRELHVYLVAVAINLVVATRAVDSALPHRPAATSTSELIDTFDRREMEGSNLVLTLPLSLGGELTQVGSSFERN